MRLLFDLAVAIAVALVVGLLSASMVLERGPAFGMPSVGEWRGWSESGSPADDPYSGAVLARTGELPLGSGEGLAMSADTDQGGSPLTGRCQYTIVGQTPPARLWTLTAYDSGGHLMPNEARRSGFQSREIVRRADGSFEIAVGPEVMPGNWLPVQAVDRFRLVMRLYDSPHAAGTPLAELTMPHIVRGACS